MGASAYTCSYILVATGQEVTYNCSPCVSHDCWAGEVNLAEMGGCPPCTNTTLAWYYWLIIAVGILAVILAIIGGLVRYRRQQKER